jgi:hypothetical protein
MATPWIEQADDTPKRRGYLERLAAAFEASPRGTAEKLDSFPKYVPLTAVARLMGRYELYKLAEGVPGAIVEAGVLHGAGLMSFAHFAFLLEPHNPYRRIIGFDTFEGFPSLTAIDAKGQSRNLKPGAYRDDSLDELIALAQIHEDFRFLKSRPQIELVKGDICQTVPAYIQEHPELVVALLYLDADLQAPTRTCLKHLVPRMPKGGVVVFDELAMREFPGETAAVVETLGLRSLRLRRLPFLKACYAVLE